MIKKQFALNPGILENKMALCIMKINNGVEDGQ
jgi:hypothetical protein